MSHTYHSLRILVTALSLAILFMGVSLAHAASPLGVTFNPDPLFVQENFLPEDDAVGEVTVDNLGTDPQTVIVEAVHVLDPDGLSSQLHLLIEKASGGSALYDGSFETFLTGGEQTLSVLSGGSSEMYTFTVSFNNTNDNGYQGKTLGFNLCVGFQGGR